MILGLALSISQINGMEVGRSFLQNNVSDGNCNSAKIKVWTLASIDLIIQKVKHQTFQNIILNLSLLHGNLWIENTAIVGNQTFTYDPACYWGDRECDLAFSELFQPFSPEFYEIYDRTFPLDKEGFEERKHLYQLYYLLNFSHRFNGSYINLTTKLIEELLLE